MPPKSRPTTSTSPLKRKALTDDDSDAEQQPVKRTRSSGPATNYVPIAGAPETLPKARNHPASSKIPVPTAKSSKSTATATASKADGKGLEGSKPKPAARARRAVTDSSSEGSSSEDELSLKGPISPTRASATRAKSKLVMEVSVPTGRPKTYQKTKSPRSAAPATDSSEESESEEDVLLLRPSPPKSPNKPHKPFPSSPTKSAIRRRDDSAQPSSGPGSPSKRARFAAAAEEKPIRKPFPSGSASPTKPTRTRTEEKKPAHSPTKATSPTKTKTPVRRPPPKSDSGEEEESDVFLRSPTKKKSARGTSSPSKATLKTPGTIKKPQFIPTATLTTESDGESETAVTSDADAELESEALPTRLKGTKKAAATPFKPPRKSLELHAQIAKQKSASPAPSGDSPNTLVSEEELPPHPHPTPAEDVAPTLQLPAVLPADLIPYFDVQKRVTMRALSRPSPGGTGSEREGTSEMNVESTASLVSLLEGTSMRGEGNSALVMGPRGSGKTLMIERALSQLESVIQAQPNNKKTPTPIVIRLSGDVHTNDRLAMREIGRQLIAQNVSSDFEAPPLVDDDEENDERADDIAGEDDVEVRVPTTLPPPSHMSSLITTLSSLSRPTIVILDSFDLFTAHPRQALLYCLLDTVQSCRAGVGRQGVAVVGVTTRVDTLNLLEKRVKSRFSHRIIRCTPPTSLAAFTALGTSALCTPFTLDEAKGLLPAKAKVGAFTKEGLRKWKMTWEGSVKICLTSREGSRLVKEIYELSRDMGLLNRILLSAVLALSHRSPWLSAPALTVVSRAQRGFEPWSFLPGTDRSSHRLIKRSSNSNYSLLSRSNDMIDLPIPQLILLVSSFHAQTVGHELFTFEQIHETYERVVRTASHSSASSGANGPHPHAIAIDGVVVGLPRISREVMLGAFQALIQSRAYLPCDSSNTNTMLAQFVRYRCDVPRMEVKAAVEKRGHTQLKRWLMRPT